MPASARSCQYGGSSIANDLDLAKKIAQSSPIDQAREFGRIEAQFATSGGTTPKANKVTKAAQPPTKRRGGSGVTKVDPANESFPVFEARMNKALEQKSA